MIRADLWPVANHLWQSTLCVAAAWGLTLALRENRAAVRYWVWLAASVKFSIPFSWLVIVGGQLGWRLAPLIARPPMFLATSETGRPFALPAPALQAITPSAPDAIPGILFAVWIFGFAVSVVLWVRCWLQIRTARRGAAPLPMSIEFPIPVLLCATRVEPGVFGIRKPVLLLPEGITERLAPAELKAILAHELCHVRRWDNLTAAIHMAVETVFWFFPPVWWVRARMAEERERACDEEVLRLGNEPRVYAEGILNVCRSYLESPLACVSGVTGADLKKRIQAILTGRVGGELNFAKKAALAIAGMAAVAGPVVVGMMNAPRIMAQSQLGLTRSAIADAPKFKTASFTPCKAVRGSNGRDFTGTSFSECVTVERMIWQAYGPFANGHMNPLSSLTITGGPAWVRSGLYEIDAKAERPQSRAAMNGPMLQGVLEDRLKLNVHRETREVPVYALTVAKGGFKPRPFQGVCIPPDFDSANWWKEPPSQPGQPPPTLCGTSRRTSGGIDMNAATMADLRMFFLVTLDRPVVDETGMAGRFDFHVELPNEPFSSRARGLFEQSGPAAPAIEPSLISQTKTAAKKLGLNLEPAERPGEFLEIDHVERPAGN